MNRFNGSEECLFLDTDFMNIKAIDDYLNENGICHVKILEGDYKGSIAKFTLESNHSLYNRAGGGFNIRPFWYGRISWKGKRNNPKFTISHNSRVVLLDYGGKEVFERVNLKAKKEELLNLQINDIDGKSIAVGDNVLYMNIRYGIGSSLCHGIVKEFKPNARQGYVSVIVQRRGVQRRVNVNIHMNKFISFKRVIGLWENL